MIFLTPEQLLYIHYRIIETTGGSHGIINIGSIESALGRIQATFKGQELVPDIFGKAAALMESLVMNHPFVDGNKRVGISAAALFLELNGYQLNANQKQVVSITLRLAQGKISVKKLALWLKKNSKQSRNPNLF